LSGEKYILDFFVNRPSREGCGFIRGVGYLVHNAVPMALWKYNNHFSTRQEFSPYGIFIFLICVFYFLFLIFYFFTHPISDKSEPPLPRGDFSNTILLFFCSSLVIARFVRPDLPGIFVNC
jgi:hypothetical protein